MTVQMRPVDCTGGSKALIIKIIVSFGYTICIITKTSHTDGPKTFIHNNHIEQLALHAKYKNNNKKHIEDTTVAAYAHI